MVNDEHEEKLEEDPEFVEVKVDYPEPGSFIEYRLAANHFIADKLGRRVYGPCKLTFTMPPDAKSEADVEVTKTDLVDGEDAYQVLASYYGLGAGTATDPKDPERKINVLIIKVEDVATGNLIDMLMPVPDVNRLCQAIIKTFQQLEENRKPKIIIAGPGSQLPPAPGENN